MIFNKYYKQMKNKKKWLYIFLALVGVVLIISAILKAITPSQPTIKQSLLSTQNLNETSSDFSNIVLAEDIADIHIPETITLYEAMPNKLGFDNIISDLIATYSLTQKTDGLWLNDSYYLSIKPPGDKFKFSSVIAPESTAVLDKNAAVAICDDFIQKNLSDHNLRKYSEKISFYEGVGELFESSEERAVWIKIPYSLFVDNYPVYLSNAKAIPATCLVSSDQKVHKFELQNILFTLKPSITTATITIEEALTNINQKNLAAIIDFNMTEFSPLNIAEIKSGKLTEVSFEYRLDPDLQLIAPYYRFKGILINHQNQNIEVELITPAIETQASN